MKIAKYITMLFVASIALGSCGEKKLNEKSIFETNVELKNTELDKWLDANYTTPYNIMVNWRYDDNEISHTHNVDPAMEDAAKTLLSYIKHVWIGAYEELFSADEENKSFLKSNAPRILQLIGSPEYNNDGSETLGIAEGGVKITLTNVNVAKQGAERNDAYWRKIVKYCFHVMYHEFGHILNQKKEYPTDFKLVSVKDYKSHDWVNLNNEDAPKFGFISGYASSNDKEDFVELIAFYLTTTPEKFQAMCLKGLKEVAQSEALTQKGELKEGFVQLEEKYYDARKTADIYKKLDIVKDYMRDSWSIDMDKLRTIVLRRIEDLKDETKHNEIVNN